MVKTKSIFSENGKKENSFNNIFLFLLLGVFVIFCVVLYFVWVSEGKIILEGSVGIMDSFGMFSSFDLLVLIGGGILCLSFGFIFANIRAKKDDKPAMEIFFTLSIFTLFFSGAFSILILLVGGLNIETIRDVLIVVLPIFYAFFLLFGILTINN